MTGEPLPQLLDARAIRAEMGVSRAAAEKIMRAVPAVVIPGLRKTYARRCDVLALLDEHTYDKTRPLHVGRDQEYLHR